METHGSVGVKTGRKDSMIDLAFLILIPFLGVAGFFGLEILNDEYCERKYKWAEDKWHSTFRPRPGVLRTYQTRYDVCQCCGAKTFRDTIYLYRGIDSLDRYADFLRYHRETSGITKFYNKIWKIKFTDPETY